jgi:hypothetical protein
MEEEAHHSEVEPPAAPPDEEPVATKSSLQADPRPEKATSPTPITRIKPRWHISKKARIAIYSVSALVLICLVALAINAYKQQTNKVSGCSGINGACPSPALTANASSSPSATPQLAPRLLDGVLADPAKQNLHPLAVMIENAPEARPQSGLGEASLVYEAIAEGGITRFMAIYADPTDPIRVGPVRSSRPYFVDIATELNAFYAHVGGSADALSQIKNTGVLDLDQFYVGEPTYKRDFSRNVAFEHTVYSSTDKLWQYATQINKWSSSGNFTAWKYTDDAPPAQRGASETVKVSVSDSLYAVTWTYDPTNNVYIRNMAGAAHTDSNTGKTITAKNIILQSVVRTSTDGLHNNMTLTGSGTAIVIENGKAIQGTWKKSGRNRTRFYDASGQELSLVRGETWIHLVNQDSVISY